MKKVYIAEDGTQFDNEQDCIAYEEKATLKAKLSQLVRSKYYGTDISFISRIVADFIVANFKQISEIVESNKPKWILNLNNFNDYAPVPGTTMVEVKRRCGSTQVGLASEWRSSWRSADNHGIDIVEYRILKASE